MENRCIAFIHSLPAIRANGIEKGIEIMKFVGINNQSVEIRITNYQFPNIKDYKYDANWLLIYLNVKSNVGNWNTIDPALLTFEVKDIINWFQGLLSNQIENKELFFIEPCLEFELIKNTENLKTIRIKFDLEFLPQNADDEKEYYVDCEMNNYELKKVIEDLKRELEKYPERKVKNSR